MLESILHVPATVLTIMHPDQNVEPTDNILSVTDPSSEHKLIHMMIDPTSEKLVESLKHQWLPPIAVAKTIDMLSTFELSMSDFVQISRSLYGIKTSSLVLDCQFKTVDAGPQLWKLLQHDQISSFSLLHCKDFENWFSVLKSLKRLNHMTSIALSGVITILDNDNYSSHDAQTARPVFDCLQQSLITDLNVRNLFVATSSSELKSISNEQFREQWSNLLVHKQCPLQSLSIDCDWNQNSTWLAELISQSRTLTNLSISGPVMFAPDKFAQLTSLRICDTILGRSSPFDNVIRELNTEQVTKLKVNTDYYGYQRYFPHIDFRQCMSEQEVDQLCIWMSNHSALKTVTFDGCHIISSHLSQLNAVRQSNMRVDIIYENCTFGEELPAAQQDLRANPIFTSLMHPQEDHPFNQEAEFGAILQAERAFGEEEQEFYRQHQRAQQQRAQLQAHQRQRVQHQRAQRQLHRRQLAEQLRIAEIEDRARQQRERVQAQAARAAPPAQASEATPPTSLTPQQLRARRMARFG